MRDLPQRNVLSRRQFLGGAGAALGASALLTACGSSPNGQSAKTSATGALVFAAEQDNTGTLAGLVKAWNKANPHSHVTYQSIPPTTNDVYSQYVTALAGGASTPDVLSLDVTYPGTFAAAGWLHPLDSFVGQGLRSSFAQSALEAGTYQGKLYALPQYLDAGQLYYRTDLLAKYHATVPTTIQEMVALAQRIQAAERKTNPHFWGFVWEGAKIEAVFDQFCEWNWAYGGSLSDGHKVTIDTQPGRQAMQFMHDTIYKLKISPPGTSTMKPSDAVVLMQNGNALFMRNWVFAYSLLENAGQSKVAGKVAIAPLPGASGTGHGCTGGWMFGINAKSAHPGAAWRFIQFMTAKPQQTKIAVDAGLVPGRTDVLQDSAVVAKSPNLKEMPTILASARNRPSIKNYPEVSSKIQGPLNAVISNQQSVASGLQAAQSAISGAVVS